MLAIYYNLNSFRNLRLTEYFLAIVTILIILDDFFFRKGINFQKNIAFPFEHCCLTDVKKKNMYNYTKYLVSFYTIHFPATTLRFSKTFIHLPNSISNFTRGIDMLIRHELIPFIYFSIS